MLHFICIFQVTGVVGRAETLSAIFFILAFTVYVKATLKRNTTGKPLLFSEKITSFMHGGMTHWKGNFVVRTSLVSRFVLIMSSSSKSGKWSLTTWPVVTSRYNMCTCTCRYTVSVFQEKDWYFFPVTCWGNGGLCKKSADCVNPKWQG